MIGGSHPGPHNAVRTGHRIMQWIMKAAEIRKSSSTNPSPGPSIDVEHPSLCQYFGNRIGKRWKEALENWNYGEISNSLKDSRRLVKWYFKKWQCHEGESVRRNDLRLSFRLSDKLTGTVQKDWSWEGSCSFRSHYPRFGLKTIDSKENEENGITLSQNRRFRESSNI